MEEASAVTAAAIEHTEIENGIEDSSLDEETESMIPDDSKGDEEREIDSAKEALLQVCRYSIQTCEPHSTMRVRIGVHMSVFNKKLLDSDKNLRKLISKCFY